MTDLNLVGIVGRVVKQPDLVQKGESGVNLLTFSLAVNRDYKKKDTDGNYSYEERVSYFDFTLFGKRAENLQKYLTKGKLVTVEGYLEQDRWTSDGKNFSRIKIVPVKIDPFVERVSKENQSEVIEETVEVEETVDYCEQEYPVIF